MKRGYEKGVERDIEVTDRRCLLMEIVSTFSDRQPRN
jgi:hypothetical protein